jgi:SAM-dependent methyltransferase
VLREFLFDAEREVWPFDAGAFDLVVVCHVMEHFARDPMFAFAEANRVLAPAGRLFVVVPNGASALHVDMLIRGETPNTCPFYSAIPSERHHREFTPGELRVLGEAAGFTVDRIETYNPGRCGAARLRTLLALGLLVEMRDRRDALAAVFVKSGPVRERRPTAMRLYRKAEG